MKQSHIKTELNEHDSGPIFMVMLIILAVVLFGMYLDALDDVAFNLSIPTIAAGIAIILLYVVRGVMLIGKYSRFSGNAYHTAVGKQTISVLGCCIALCISLYVTFPEILIERPIAFWVIIGAINVGMKQVFVSTRATLNDKRALGHYTSLRTAGTYPMFNESRKEAFLLGYDKLKSLR